ncbi:MAG TPA: hypothetical protein VIN04_10095 [Myxococcota bacterium]
MVARSAKLVALYVVGALVIGGWSLEHLLGGTVTRENAALVLVLPLAWMFGFWPTVVPIVLAHRLWRLQSHLEELMLQRRMGLSTGAAERELEDTLVMLAAHENGIPERWARRLVRRAARMLREAPAGEVPRASDTPG